MDKNVGFRTLPKNHRQMVRERLRRELEQSAAQFNITQAFVGYVDDDNLIWVDPGLWIGRDQFPVLILDTTEGICGLAARRNEVYAYPLDFETRERIVIPGNLLTIAEMAGPIRFRNKVTGVVLLHCAEEPCRFNDDGKAAFRRILARMDDDIRYVDEARERARTRLKNIAGRCLELTDGVSERGYIAIKDWDGGLEYFTAGEKDEPFLNLDQWEGLCGQVLTTGRHIISGDVLEDPAYKASDPEIRSEIVYPIFNEDETIGVINLESKSFDAYESSVAILRIAAEDASDPARSFRQPPDDHFGYLLGDYLGSVAGLIEHESRKAMAGSGSNGEVEAQIIRLLRAKALKAINGIRAEWWPEASSASARTSVADADGVFVGGIDGSPGRFTVHRSVTVSGVSDGEIAIEKESYEPEDPHIVEAFCRVTAFFLQHWDRESRSRACIRLLQRLTIHRDLAGIVDEAVRLIPTIVGGEHCTLFYKASLLGRTVFVPGASTSDQVFRPHRVLDGNPWYEASPSAGLTAWVGCTGKPLRIKNIQDSGELSQIDSRINWRGWLSEEGPYARSYLACPVFQPDNEETPDCVMGVLRTYRLRKSHHSGFSEDDLLMLQTIARMLARPLCDVIPPSISSDVPVVARA